MLNPGRPAESHPRWLPESGERSVACACSGSRAGCWAGCGRPAGWQASGLRVPDRSARPVAAVNARLLLLQKQINKTSLRPVVTVWQEGRQPHQSADICEIAARICGGICSVRIKGAVAARALKKQPVEKGSEEENVSQQTQRLTAPAEAWRPRDRRQALTWFGLGAGSNLHRCEHDGASLAVLWLSRSRDPRSRDP